MPLLLDKILTLLAMPIGVAGIAAVCALAALVRGRCRVAAGLLVFSTIWLWGWSTPFVADHVTNSLVERHPPRPAAELTAADARAARPVRTTTGSGMPHGFTTPARPRWSSRPAVSCGPGTARSDASVMQIQLRALGVPDHATIIENDSRNTRQNALFVAELAASLGIEHVLLVTSAYHMPRAGATFGNTALHVTEGPHLRG